MPQGVALLVYPALPVRLIGGMQCFSQAVEMLAGMIKIQHLIGVFPALVDQSPDPGRTVGNGKGLSGSAQTLPASLPMEPFSQFHSVSLPAKVQFFQPLTIGIVILMIKHAHLLFVPFHAGFLRFFLSPVRPTMPHLIAIDHDDGKRAGGSFGGHGLRQGFESLLCLLLRPRTQSLHQLTHRGVLDGDAQLASQLRGAFIRARHGGKVS